MVAGRLRATHCEHCKYRKRQPHGPGISTCGVVKWSSRTASASVAGRCASLKFVPPGAFCHAAASVVRAIPGASAQTGSATASRQMVPRRSERCNQQTNCGIAKQSGQKNFTDGLGSDIRPESDGTPWQRHHERGGKFCQESDGVWCNTTKRSKAKWAAANKCVNGEPGS